MTAICRRYGRRPANGSVVSRKMMRKGLKAGEEGGRARYSQDTSYSWRTRGKERKFLLKIRFFGGIHDGRWWNGSRKCVIMVADGSVERRGVWRRETERTTLRTRC